MFHFGAPAAARDRPVFILRPSRGAGRARQDPALSAPRSNIAVIGGGIAGLCAAWLLGRVHRVTLYERQAQPGFVASSVSLPFGDGLPRVDVPLRVFYPGYYPTLTRLYDELGIASQPVSYAATFTGADGRPYFRYRNLRWGDSSWGMVAPQDLLGRRARRITAGLLRFHGEALPAWRRGELAGVSLGEFVDAGGFSEAFVEGFLLPAVCTVCTCSTDAARQFPAAVIVDYLARGLTRQSVRRACDGADAVAAKLLAGIGQVHCNVAIDAVRRRGRTLAVRTADGHEAVFDHVVLATQANQALPMLEAPTADERRVLGGFRYEPVEVLMHTDAALMPRHRADWSPVNLRVSPAHDRPMSTIWVNAVQPPLRRVRDVFQSVHPCQAPKDEAVIGHARFERPVVDARSAAALQGLERLHAEADRRVWFCGSYAQAGIPLLESAVASAHRVARLLGVPLEDQGPRVPAPLRGLRAEISA